MNNLRNKVSLIGRLGGNPEMVKFESGKTVARFMLATNERYKDKNGEWKDNTQWHVIRVWGPLAEKAGKLLEKGKEIILEGKLLHHAYETKNGEKRMETIIEANEFLLLSPKQTDEK